MHTRPTLHRGRSTSAVPWLAVLLLADAGHAAPALDFPSTVIDPAQSGDCKALVDLNGDGRDDAVVAGLVMYWYEAPNWARHTIATAASEFTTDMEATDIDGDGDNDLIVPDGTDGVYWFENLGNGGAWAKHLVGATGGKYCHDVAVGDIDGDGDQDVVGRPLNGNLYIFLQDAGLKWTAASRVTASGEGLALADLDGDGRLDIVVNGQWHEAPDGNAGTGVWPVHVYDTSKLSLSAKVAAADLNRDGRLDVALSPSEGLGEIAWYEAPATPATGSWTRHVLLASADRQHSLQLVDLDGDGWPDVLTAQMHTASGTPSVDVYLNPGTGGGAWTRAVIDQVPSHNLAVGDIDADGRIDLLGCDYIGTPPVRVWLNRTSSLSVESEAPPRAMALAAAPNPFNASVQLTVTSSAATPVTLRIYDQGGRLINVLAERVAVSGERRITWDGRDRQGRQAAAGLYIAVMTAGRESVERKLMLVP